MAEHGVSASPIPSDPDGVPLFPKDLAGSLSHKDALCIAVVARKVEFRSVGVDMERVESLAPDILRRFIRKDEESFIHNSGLAFPIAATVLWAAKEAFYKCIYPELRVKFGFLDIRVQCHGNALSVDSSVSLDVGSSVICGEFQSSGRYIFAGFWWRTPVQTVSTRIY